MAFGPLRTGICSHALDCPGNLPVPSCDRCRWRIPWNRLCDAPHESLRRNKKHPFPDVICAQTNYMMVPKKNNPLLKVRIFVAVATAFFIVQAAPSAYASTVMSQSDFTVLSTTASVDSLQFLGTPNLVFSGLTVRAFAVATRTLTFSIVACTDQYFTSCLQNLYVLPTKTLSPGGAQVTFSTTTSLSLGSTTRPYYYLRIASSGAVTFYGSSASSSLSIGTSGYTWAYGSPTFTANINHFYFDLFDLGGSTLVGSDSYIISVVPDNVSVSSTTYASLSVHSYVSPRDVGSTFIYQLESDNSVLDSLGLGSNDSSFYFQATTSGDQYYTSVLSYLLPPGTYHSIVRFRSYCVLGVCALPVFDNYGFEVSTTTTWYVDSHSAYGLENLTTYNAITEAFGTAASTTASMTQQYCYTSFSTFDVSKCIGALFIPSKAEVQASLKNFYENSLLKRFPFGYVTRVSNILNSTTTLTTLPGLTFTIPSGLPAGGDTLDLSPWGKLWGPTSYLGTQTSSYASGKTLRQIVEPYWNDIVDIFLGLSLLAIAIKIKGLKPL